MTCPTSQEAPFGYCFWVQLPNAIFGNYLFQIESIEVLGKEIVLQIKQLKNNVTRPTNIPKQTINTVTNWNEYFNMLKESFSENLLYFLTNVLTLKNIFQVSSYPKNIYI